MVYKRFFFYSNMYRFSLENQPTFREGTTGFPAKRLQKFHTDDV